MICEDETGPRIALLVESFVDAIGELVSKYDEIRIDEVDDLVVEVEVDLADADSTVATAFEDEDSEDMSASLSLATEATRIKADDVIGFAMLEKGLVVAMLFAFEVW